MSTGALDWKALAEELTGEIEFSEPVPDADFAAFDEFAPSVEVVPSAEGDLLSGDDALAWLESLTLGKEKGLRAQADVEAQARVNEILGRKPEAPPPPELTEPKLPTIVEETVASWSPEPQPVKTTPAIDFGTLTLDALRGHVREHIADYAARLALARALLAEGEIDEALENYIQLVQANAEMPQVMADLRQATADHPQNTAALQTLGDAYMVQGMVDQALEIYNQAMNLL